MKTGIDEARPAARHRAGGGRPRAGGAVDGARVPRPADLPDLDPVPGHDVRRPLQHRVRREPRRLLRRSPTTRSTRASTRCGSASQAGAPAVQIVGVTTLRDAAGQPFAPLSLDPEGLALTKDDTLVITSEGFAARLIDPWVREFGLDGRQLGVAAAAVGVPAERGRHARRPPEPRLRERRDAAERPLPLHRAPRTRSSRTARRRRSPPAARRGCCATTSSGARSTASTSTGRIRSPSRPCPRPSSRSTASSRCCR